MSSDAVAPNRDVPELDGRGMRIAIVCARFNDLVTRRLLDGTRRALEDCKVDADDVTVVWVPGALELPLAAKTYATAGDVDAVIALGCVIRGETTHYDIVAGESARGVQDVALATGVPVLFGVLTTEDLDQALARSEDPGGHNVGEECGRGAVEMVALVRGVQRSVR